jgi:ribosomal protein S19
LSGPSHRLSQPEAIKEAERRKSVRERSRSMFITPDQV